MNAFSNLFIVAILYTFKHMLCIVAIVDCTYVHHVGRPLQNNQTIPYLVAIVDCTTVESAMVSIEEMVISELPIKQRRVVKCSWEDSFGCKLEKFGQPETVHAVPAGFREWQ